MQIRARAEILLSPSLAFVCS